MRRRRVYRDREVLELFADEPELVAIVDAVAETQDRWRGRRRAAVVGLVGAAIAVVASIVLPWRGGDSSLVAAARAAVGDGRVVHVVSSRVDERDELIDLTSGQSRPATIEVETWFDERAQRLRALTRRQGVVVSDALGTAASTPEATEPTALDFARGYRTSLERGGNEVRRGPDDVSWLALDVAGARFEVAVDRDSHLARRYRRLDRDGIWTVRQLDSRPLRVADFRSRLKPAAYTAGAVVGATPTTAVAAARRLPGVVWAGAEVSGRRLVDVRLERLVKRGRARRVSSTGVRLVYGGSLLSGGLEVRQAAAAEPAYGFAEARRTLGFNALPPVGTLDLVAPVRGGVVWTGQLRVGSVYVTVRGTSRRAVVEVAKALRLYK